jgi:dipeptidase E
MKLLLTSAGITNDSIRDALVDLLGRPVEEATAVLIPTAIYALPDGPADAWEMARYVGDMGWTRLGIIELTALPTVEEDHWLPAVEAADAIIVGGGNTGYLSYWLQQSGFADKLPDLLRDTVYVGVSAGSAMVTHGVNVDRDRLERTGIYYDDEYDEAAPPGAGSDWTLKVVDFEIRPHLNADYFPQATMEFMERAAAKLDVPLYAFDDETALKVVDGKVEVVSEGQWRLFDDGAHR